ncbi:unnamed protein product [Cochlearia groenlandica]
MEGGSVTGSASTLSKDENLVVSCEDSSSPVENELELGLTLSVGRKGFRDFVVSYAYDDDDSSSSSSSSSLSRASVAPGIKRTADSMAATSGQVVGWPPIRTYRMNSMVNQAKTLLATEDPNAEIRQEVNKNRNDATKTRNSMFVKVTMDGIPIGRKIDLNAHKCYESLSNALEDMFLNPKTGLCVFLSNLVAFLCCYLVFETLFLRSGSSTRETDGQMETRVKILPDGSSGLVLTYEDKEGDWMLVGDVPWGMFIDSVRRLRIMKTSEATGAAQMIL